MVRVIRSEADEKRRRRSGGLVRVVKPTTNGTELDFVRKNHPGDVGRYGSP